MTRHRIARLQRRRNSDRKRRMATRIIVTPTGLARMTEALYVFQEELIKTWPIMLEQLLQADLMATEILV